MNNVTVTEARDHLADLVNQVAFGGQTYCLQRRGRKLAALVPIKLLLTFQQLLQRQASPRSASPLPKCTDCPEPDQV